MAKTTMLPPVKGRSALQDWKKDFKRNGTLYLLVIPVIVYYIIFHYKPIYGALMAFQDFAPRLGIWGSKWVGLKHFKAFFTSPDFGRLLKNTLTISISTLIVSFPAPIILALLLNEIHRIRIKKVVQTASYMPHFISLVVVCGMVKSFVSDTGFIGQLIGIFTGSPRNLLLEPKCFVPIYVVSNVWQSIGWDSIIYLAALSAVDVQQYEAADIDGAGRLKKMLYITFPGIMPTVIMMLILKIGSVMNVGFEKIILLYNPATYETADVISSFVYRQGFETQNWSYSTAVGLFNSVVNFILLLTANRISRKTSETSLW